MSKRSWTVEKKKTKEGADARKKDPVGNQGKMLVDATVAEQVIRYPTDLSLLNESREISKNLIDELYKLTKLKKKPRTYRQQARKRHLALAKKRNPGGKTRRKGTRKQLQYLRRNYRYIEELLDLIDGRCFPLPHKRQRQYWIIQHVYDQQFTMYKNKKRRCDDRIVSIHQPHVRPIIGGKASHKVEFGSKLSVSMVDGIAIVDRFGWDTFNESTDLIDQIERYKTDVVVTRRLYLPMECMAPWTNGNTCKKRGSDLVVNPLIVPKRRPQKTQSSSNRENSRDVRTLLTVYPLKASSVRARMGTSSTMVVQRRWKPQGLGLTASSY